MCTVCHVFVRIVCHVFVRVVCHVLCARFVTSLCALFVKYQTHVVVAIYTRTQHETVALQFHSTAIYTMKNILTVTTLTR